VGEGATGVGEEDAAVGEEDAEVGKGTIAGQGESRRHARREMREVREPWGASEWMRSNDAGWGARRSEALSREQARVTGGNEVVWE
jgi:hypothetical protein